MKTALLSKTKRVPSRSALCRMNVSLEAENAKLREALKKIVQGGYGPGSDIAHPAVSVARNALFS